MAALDLEKQRFPLPALKTPSVISTAYDYEIVNRIPEITALTEKAAAGAQILRYILLRGT